MSSSVSKPVSQTVPRLSGQIAKVTGIHRCLGDDQTINAREGEDIPLCSCGKGPWAYFAEDNIPDTKLFTVEVGVHCRTIKMTVLPEERMILYLRSVRKMLDGRREYDGPYVIIEVELEEEAHIRVCQTGNLMGEYPFHHVW